MDGCRGPEEGARCWRVPISPTSEALGAVGAGSSVGTGTALILSRLRDGPEIGPLRPPAEIDGRSARLCRPADRRRAFLEISSAVMRDRPREASAGTVFREELTAMLPRLHAFARGLAAGDRSWADDLVQDTMLNALRAQARLTPGENLGVRTSGGLSTPSASSLCD